MLRRGLAVGLAIALLAGLTPIAGAADPPLLEDPAGDVVVRATPGEELPGAPVSNLETARGSDLVSLAAAETDETIRLTLAVASLSGATAFTNARVDLGWDGGDFALYLGHFRELGGEDRSWARLAKTERDEREFIAQFPVAVDIAAGTLAVEIPKVYLVSAEGRVPGRGDALELRAVESTASVGFGPLGTVQLYDRMPDEGDGATLVLAQGDFTQGRVVLSSPDRVRVSNGGATTFVFQATIRNTGEVETEFDLALEDVPEGWNASVRSPLKVPRAEERTVSVLVSVPFAHDHGGYSSFNLTVQSQADPATRAKMRLGILHTPIPQPAGHHPDLYLHAEERDVGGPAAGALNTAFPSGFGWMNTQADHTEDAPYVTPNSFGDDTAWHIPLNPALQLGLDFDLERLGELQASILGRRTGEAELAATLYYETAEGDEDDRIVLAEAEPVTLTLDPQTPTPFALTLIPTNESDYIAYRNGARMVLVLALEGAPTDRARFTTLDPWLMVEDFVLSLPLNEYHDKLTGLHEAAASLEIVANGPVEKLGLPGSVLTYAFSVRNGGPTDVFVVDLAGNHAHAGIAVPAGELPLATGETREITLAVEVPIDSNEGEEIDVLLFVHGRDDPSKMAIARTKTRVTHDATQAHEDEARLLLEAQAREAPTPGPALALTLAIILVATLARRRQ